MSALQQISVSRNPFSSLPATKRSLAFSQILFFSFSRTRTSHRLCSKTSDDEGQTIHISKGHKRSAEHEGSKESNGSGPAKPFTFNDYFLMLMQRLKRYGVAGVLSYGLLNTVYYLSTFLLVWFYALPAPGGMGYAAAVGRFLQVMAMVWAGSQVTKVVRLGGAVALAPFVDRGLSWFTEKFNFQSELKASMAIVSAYFRLALLLFFIVKFTYTFLSQAFMAIAFMAIVCACFGLALLLFLVVTLVWA